MLLIISLVLLQSTQIFDIKHTFFSKKKIYMYTSKVLEVSVVEFPVLLLEFEDTVSFLPSLSDFSSELIHSISASKPVGYPIACSTFTATWSFAVFLDGPEASYVVPSTSTDIVKTGAWTGPDWDKSLYWSPGLIWFNLISEVCCFTIQNFLKFRFIFLLGSLSSPNPSSNGLFRAEDPAPKKSYKRLSVKTMIPLTLPNVFNMFRKEKS